MLIQRGRKPLHLNARGAILERIERAVELDVLAWEDNEAYARLMNVILPEDFPLPDVPLLSTKRGPLTLATLVRGRR